MELILFTSEKQPTEEQLYAALKPLEEPKVYDSGEIGYLIRGGQFFINRQIEGKNILFYKNNEKVDVEWKLRIFVENHLNNFLNSNFPFFYNFLENIGGAI